MFENDDIPEPDWTEFRASVRDKLLYRSMQRASEVRRWKLAWAFSVIGFVVISTSLLWNVKFSNEGSDPMLQNYPAAPAIEVADWPQTRLFDDLVQLEGNEEEELRQMLEAAQ